MAERRAGLSEAEQVEHAHAAVARLLALPAFAALRARAAAGEAAWLSGYVAIRGELDVGGAIDAARAAGVGVALPRIDTRRPPRLCFHETRHATDLAAGPHGLTEPNSTSREVDVADLDVVLVPGIAFDAAGRRVGTGGGFYDDAGRRLRASGRGGVMVGVAHDFQIVDRCPAEAHDVAVDLVVTERRVLAAQAQSQSGGAS